MPTQNLTVKVKQINLEIKEKLPKQKQDKLEILPRVDLSPILYNVKPENSLLYNKKELAECLYVKDYNVAKFIHINSQYKLPFICKYCNKITYRQPMKIKDHLTCIHCKQKIWKSK